MTVTAAWFGNAGKHLVLGDVAYVADNIKCMLLDSSYAFDQDNHETYADVVADEIAAGNGYATRGVLLGSKSVTYDAPTNRTRLFAANSVWTPSAGESLAASHAIIYKDSGTDSTSWLLGYVNFGATITAIGAPFTINWDPTDGALYTQAS